MFLSKTSLRLVPVEPVNITLRGANFGRRFTRSSVFIEMIALNLQTLVNGQVYGA